MYVRAYYVGLPGFEPGSLDSESKVLTITPQAQAIYIRSYGAIGSASDSRPEGWGFESL